MNWVWSVLDHRSRAGSILTLGWFLGLFIVSATLRSLRPLAVAGLEGVPTSIRLFSQSIEAVLAVAVPALLAGILVWALRRTNPIPLKNPSLVILVELAFQTTGFCLLAIGSLWVAPGLPFVQDIVLMAWILGILFGCARPLALAGQLGGRQKVFFSRAMQVVIDALLVATSLVLAYLIRFDGLPPIRFQQQMLWILPYVVGAQIGLNFAAGVYQLVWRFVGLREALCLARTSMAFVVGLILTNLIFSSVFAFQRVPLGVLLLYGMLALGLQTSARVARRTQYARSLRKSETEGEERRLLLIGAGRAGRLLVNDLEQHPEVQLLGFLDDNPHNQRRRIHGLKVLGTTHDLPRVLEENEVDEVILCMPSTSRYVVRRLVEEARRHRVKTLTIPSLAEMVLKNEAVTQVRPVKMEDLLGRPAVVYPSDDIDLIKTYRNKSVLVTGAGGSIGSELCLQLRAFRPRELILLDKDENSLYETGLEVRENYEGVVSHFVANVRDRQLLSKIFRSVKPEVVFHAAAYKHVPMMESDPSEAILNNVKGSRNVMELAAEVGVDSFVLISTDKAVNPTSIMGATKRLAEMICQGKAQQNLPTRYCGVRFGNVLGSRASVVQLFQKRISEGKKLLITHPDITRYFMTIPEAAQLVIQAGSLGKDGQLFVLDMGDPVRIQDLARDLIELSGLEPGKDIEIEFTGLRTGEKLHEELLIKEEDRARSTKYPKIFVARALPLRWGHFDKRLTHILAAAERRDDAAICELLLEFGIGYQSPSNEARAVQQR